MAEPLQRERHEVRLRRAGAAVLDDPAADHHAGAGGACKGDPSRRPEHDLALGRPRGTLCLHEHGGRKGPHGPAHVVREPPLARLPRLPAPVRGQDDEAQCGCGAESRVGAAPGFCCLQHLLCFVQGPAHAEEGAEGASWHSAEDALWALRGRRQEDDFEGDLQDAAARERAVLVDHGLALVRRGEHRDAAPRHVSLAFSRVGLPDDQGGVVPAAREERALARAARAAALALADPLEDAVPAELHAEHPGRRGEERQLAGLHEFWRPDLTQKALEGAAAGEKGGDEAAAAADLLAQELAQGALAAARDLHLGGETSLVQGPAAALAPGQERGGRAAGRGDVPDPAGMQGVVLQRRLTSPRSALLCGRLGAWPRCPRPRTKGAWMYFGRLRGLPCGFGGPSILPRLAVYSKR
mmetsp:Transcript_95347/g.278781  ORF Transcript_95347/g.278781 Transcript_95347/m.278781 type:complete len:411 (-) Transcript_95347:88-1320(-)